MAAWKAWNKLSRLELDREDDALVTIDDEHHKKHVGFEWELCQGTSLVAGGTRVIELYVPAGTVLPHIIFEVEFQKQTRVNVSARADAGTHGAAVKTQCTDHGSDTIATTEFYYDSTAITNGTSTYYRELGDGHKIGGLASRAREIIAAPGKSTIFEIINTSAQAGLVNWCINHYEEGRGS